MFFELSHVSERKAQMIEITKLLGFVLGLAISSTSVQSQPLCDRDCQSAMARALQPASNNNPYWRLVRDELESAANARPVLRHQINSLVVEGMGGMQASVELIRRDPRAWQFQQDQVVNEIVNRVAIRYESQRNMGLMRPDVYVLFMQEFGGR